MHDIQLRQERTWDERAKEIVAGLGEALARARRPAPPARQAEAPKKTIRTSAGADEGLVIVTPIDGS